jgi:hypothetical protein
VSTTSWVIIDVQTRALSAEEEAALHSLPHYMADTGTTQLPDYSAQTSFHFGPAELTPDALYALRAKAAVIAGGHAKLVYLGDDPDVASMVDVANG